MHRCKLILFFFFCAISFSYGQDWVNMQNKGISFRQIKTEMDKKFQGKSAIKGSPNYSKPYLKYKRWEYYWRYQMNASGDFVQPKQLVKYLTEAEELKKKSSSTGNWSFVGQSTIPTATEAAYAGMGRVNCLSFDPSNANIVFAGTANGGLWKSVNGGTNWTSVGGSLAVLGVSDIAIGSTGNTIYLATGDADGQHSLSVGVIKSTDGGTSFSSTGFTHTTNSNATSQFQIHHLWINPGNDNIVIATTTSDIRRTVDGGTTWTVLDVFPYTDIKQKPSNSNILYAGSENIVFKSTDGGATWTDQSTTINGAVKIDLATSGSTVYAISDNGMGKKTVNDGANWTTMNLPSSYDTQGGYNMCIVADPSNANRVFLGGVNGWISTNGGSSWTENLNGVWAAAGDPGKYIHSDHHMLKFLPGNSNVQFTANDGGIHKGDFFNTSSTWTDLSEDLKITQYYAMDGYPTNENILIAGAQDQDGVWYDGSTWKNINNNSDGVGGAISHTNSNISFCQSQQGYLNRTTNAWTSSMEVSPQPSNSNDQADFVWPLEMDPMTSTTLYAGYGNVYKSTNNGTSWTNSTSDSNLDPYSSISVSPSAPSNVYAIKNSAIVRRTSNTGSTWSTVSSPSAGGAKFTDIEVSLTNPATAYITCGDYISGQKVFKTVNSGSAWTNISSGLPNIPIFCIAEHESTGDLYVGTQSGVYQLVSGANTWVPFQTNLPPVRVSDLNIYQTGNVLRAATFGRSIWKTPIGAGSNCPPNYTLTGPLSTSTDYETDGVIISTQVLSGGTNLTVDYDSKTRIDLNSGFTVPVGTTFKAFIDGCGGSMINGEEVDK